VIFPKDGGRGAGQSVGPFDFVAIGGDIANREEAGEGTTTIQSASTSWAQFQTDYLNGLALQDRSGRRTPLYAVPGNHDVSNAIGHYKLLKPAIDKTSMTELFNLMMKPAMPKTPATYDYQDDRIMVSHDISGVHFVFVTIWPDSVARKWMDNDLKSLSPNTPVVIFAHDPPAPDPRHFTNPNGKHNINPTDQFENLLSDTFTETGEAEKAWEAFLKQHRNITAYFHGHNNWNEFYDWISQDKTLTLHTFRADSPMKGRDSAVDETKLSFQIATIDTASQTMTVREVLWNADPLIRNAPVKWGSSITVSLSPANSRHGQD
jgi:hypothetical protein